ATIMVTTTADDIIPNDGSVSLREAITAINDGNGLGDPDITAQNPGTFGVNDTIKFTLSGSIGLTTTLSLNNPKGQPITIDGSGAGITVAGQNTVADFDITNGQTVTINNLNILGGNALGGGGISNGGILYLTNSIVELNSGGGIHNAATGSLQMTNDIVSGN